MNDISKEELEVIMALAALQLFSTSLEDCTQLENVCNELCGGGVHYSEMLKKAFYEGVNGSHANKLEQVLSHVLRETFPSVLKLSGSIQ